MMRQRTIGEARQRKAKAADQSTAKKEAKMEPQTQTPAKKNGQASEKDATRERRPTVVSWREMFEKRVSSALSKLRRAEKSGHTALIEAAEAYLKGVRAMALVLADLPDDFTIPNSGGRPAATPIEVGTSVKVRKNHLDRWAELTGGSDKIGAVKQVTKKGDVCVVEWPNGLMATMPIGTIKGA